MVVYGIKFKPTDEIVYVGQAKDFMRRKSRHFRDAKNNRNMAISQAIRKYGEENFEFIILDLVDSREQLNEREITRISEIKPRYNRCRGGARTKDVLNGIPWNKGCTDIYSEETRRAMGAHSVGVSPPNKGKTYSEEIRNKIKEKRALQVMENNKPFKHLQTGIVYKTLKEASEALCVGKEHICEVLKGKCTHAKTHTFSYDLNAPIEPPAKNMREQRKVKHNETGIVYNNIVTAAKALNIHQSKVGAVLRGERPHTKGQTFSYAD